MRRVVLTIGIIVIVVVVAGLTVIYGGMYNVAATEEHNAITLWMLETLTDNSIYSRSSEVEVADNLDDSTMIQQGFEHFDHMCVQCHGAPGIGPDEFSKGLYPTAPSLKNEVEEWTDQSLFWITKHGIKMTGMPAFGDVVDDGEMWKIVAFVRTLPEVGYYDYLDRRELAEQDGHQHEH